MRSHAKASSAVSIEGGGTARALLRRAFAVRGVSCDASGRGAGWTGHQHLVLATVCAVGAFLVFGVSAAAALQTHVFKQSFGAGVTPWGVAVDQTTGEIYVVRNGAEIYVEVRNADTTPATPRLTEADGSTPFPFVSPFGVAVDNSGGATEGYAYVSDFGTGTVKQFDASGAATAQLPITGASVPTNGTPQAGGLPNVVNSGSSGIFGEVAVASNGNVYVTDSSSNVVDVFAPNGSFVAQYGAGQLSAPNWIALDSSDNAYLANATGLVKLSPSGECVNSCAPIDPAGTLGVATDSADHVYVSEGSKIAEFDSLGNPVSTFGTPTAKPAFEGLRLSFGIAVNHSTGTVYGTDLFSSSVKVFGPLVTLPDPTIAAPAGVTPTTATFNGAVNPSGIELSECEFEYGTTNAYGQNVPCAESFAEIGSGSSPVPVHADVSSLSVESPYFVRLAAGNGSGSSASSGEPFLTPPAVGLTPQPSSESEGRSATLNALVKPWGQALSDCHFEYVTDAVFQATGFTDLGSGGSAPCKPDAASIPADSVEHPVSAHITGLVGNSIYHFRIRATNANGLSTSEAMEFTTAQTPPIVVTGEATNRTADGAYLRGTVNPSALQSTYHFEYGATSAYGSRVPLSHEAVVGNGQVPVRVAQPLTGLQPGTAYHYRLVAENSSGTEAGEDRTFTTLTPAEAPQRGYELVSTVDKGGNNIKSQYAYQSAENGNALTFVSTTPLGSSAGGPLYPRFVSVRSADAWSTKATDPPQAAVTPDLGNGPIRVTFAVSDDGSKAVVMSLKSLAPGAVEGDSNIYLLDIATDTYTTIATVPGTSYFSHQYFTFFGRALVAHGTPDFDHVFLFAEEASFLPGAPPNALYEFTGGVLSLVSISPEGVPISGSTLGQASHDVNMVSADASRVIFTSSDGVVYLRENGQTHALSESRRSVDPPGTLRPASYFGADQNLAHAYFFAQGLTDSSDPLFLSLYRYDTESGDLQLLTQASKGEGGLDLTLLQVSADGSSAYFTSDSLLTPGTPSAGANVYLYVWRGGELKLITAVSRGHDNSGLVSYWASPNGRYFAFSASTPGLTGFDSTNAACVGPGMLGACKEIYRYDNETEELICVSCRPDEKPPTGSAFISELFADDGPTQFPRVVNDRGQVFFDTPDSLVPADTTSTRDVYEYNDAVGARLITSGRGSGSSLAEVSVDGRDVFFTTQDRLVGIDKDKAVDVYDARVGGGLAGQNPPPPRGECIRDDCKAVPNGGPELPFGGSEALSGPQNVSETASKRCGKGRRARKAKGKQRCVKAVKKKKAHNKGRQGR